MGHVETVLLGVCMDKLFNDLSVTEVRVPVSKIKKIAKGKKQVAFVFSEDKETKEIVLRREVR